MYDRMLSGAEKAGLADRRHDLLAQAKGRVLEIGAGTGLNLEHYPGGVEDIVLTEPEEPMARRLERRLAASSRHGEVIVAPAEQLPFEDDSFDTVVCTLVLCTVNDPQKALSEIARVLRPGGQLLFLEHIRADDPKLASGRTAWSCPGAAFGHGCNSNRPTPAMIGDSDLSIEEIEHGEFPKRLPIVRPLAFGRARAG